MLDDVPGDERAARNDVQPAGAGVVEGAARQAPAEPAAGVAVERLRVQEHDAARIEAVVGEGGQLAVDVQLVAMRGRVVGNRDIGVGDIGVGRRGSWREV